MSLDLIRNIGILAHVDAGKTTLTEQMLFLAGAIRKPGRVDEGTAHTDSLAVERERGISVRTQAACLSWQGVAVRIVDTPGHVDFSAEVETALNALDGAVLVVSAVEGVQGQTAAIFRVLRALFIPTLIFINKTDRAGADVPRVMRELGALTEDAVLLSEGWPGGLYGNDGGATPGSVCGSGAAPDGMAGGGGAALGSVCGSSGAAPGDMADGGETDTAQTDDLLDFLVRRDDELLERALNDALDGNAMLRGLARLTAASRANPVVTGAALRGEGVGRLLGAVVRLLPAPTNAASLSAVVYRVARAGDERQAHVRVFGGELGFGGAAEHGRITRIRRLTPEGYQNAGALMPGDIGMIVGLDGLRAGDWIGGRVRGVAAMAVPALRTRVKPTSDKDVPALLAALRIMEDENPSLSLKFDQRTRELWLSIMGEVQREVIAQTLKDVHGLTATLDEPSVIYLETPLGVARGRIDMLNSSWGAEAEFEIAPGSRGSGVRYESRVNLDDVFLRYQNEIREAVLECLKEGRFGWPLADAVVTFTQGMCFRTNWSCSTFAPVVPMAVFEALEGAGTAMMEPINGFEIICDQEAAGGVIHELVKRRAAFEPPENAAGSVALRGEIPVKTSMDLQTRLMALTRGRGVMRMGFARFEICPEGEGTPIARTTLDPRNREAYMAALRG